MQHIQTLDRSNAPKINWSNWLKLPAEHGAVFALFISTLIGLNQSLFTDSFYTVAIALTLLWLTILTIHKSVLSTALAFFSGLALSILASNYLFLAIFLLCPIGNSIVKQNRSLREILGLFGVATLPIVLSSLISNQVENSIFVCIAFLAACYGASFIVHLASKQLNYPSILMLMLSLASFTWIAFQNSSLVLLLIFPFCLQLVLYKKLRSFSFKQLGLLEASYLTWIAVCISLV